MSIPYPIGWPVLYKGKETAVIIAVHCDSDEPYYTIRIYNDDTIESREKQTIAKHLSSWIDKKDPVYRAQQFQKYVESDQLKDKQKKKTKNKE